MSGREEKASGWHSGLRAGESDPTKKNGVDLMCDYTWQIMVTVWQEPVAKGRLKRRTTLLDIFNLFFFIDFFLSLLPNNSKSCMFAKEGRRQHPAHPRLQEAGDWFPFEIQLQKYAIVCLADTITNVQWLKTCHEGKMCTTNGLCQAKMLVGAASAVQNSSCSSRGPRVNSQHPHGGSQPPLTPVPGAPTSSSGLCRH